MAQALNDQICKRVDDDVAVIVLTSWVDAIIAQVQSGDYYLEIEDGDYEDSVDVVTSMMKVMLTLKDAPTEDWYNTYINFMLGVWHMAYLEDETIDAFIRVIDLA